MSGRLSIARAPREDGAIRRGRGARRAGWSRRRHACAKVCTGPREAPPDAADVLGLRKTLPLDVVGSHRGKAPKQDRVVLGRQSPRCLRAGGCARRYVLGSLGRHRNNRPPCCSLSCSQRRVASAVAACTHEAHASNRDKGRTSALPTAAGWERAGESAGNCPTDGRRAANEVILSCLLCQTVGPHDPACHAARTGVQCQRSVRCCDIVVVRDTLSTSGVACALEMGGRIHRRHRSSPNTKGAVPLF